MDDDWIGAWQAMTIARAAVSFEFAQDAIGMRAVAGMLEAKARKVIFGNDVSDFVLVPKVFWFGLALNPADEHQWRTGDFLVKLHDGLFCSVFAAEFRRSEILDLFAPEGLSKSPVKAGIISPGGRPRSELWPDWIAELASYVHEVGFPNGLGTTGVNKIIDAVADRLEKRGLESLPRSTVQPTVNAVLLRHRAEN